MKKNKNKKKLFKNKIQMIIYFILFAICIYLFVLVGKMDYKKDELPEAKKFSQIYKSVPENNLYVFATAADVYEIVNKKSGVILMGFEKNKFVEEYAYILNDICKEYKIDRILYYNFYQDRNENNGTYEAIVDKLSNYVTTDDIGTRELYAPTILVVKNGKVIGFFDEASFIKGNIKPEDYYNSEKIVELYEQIKNAILEYLW